MSDASLRLQPIKPDVADERVRHIFDDTRRVLHMPWVGALFQGYAMYPDYLELAWHELRPSLRTRQFEDDARAIGNAADEAVVRFYTPSYGKRDIAAMNLDPFAIRETVDAFHAGNPKLLLAAMALRRAFEEGSVGGAGGAQQPPPESAQEARAEHATLLMVDEAGTSDEVRRLYADIKATLRLPLVNSDYRAMAVWPAYLAQAWGDIKGVVGAEAYSTEVRRLSGLASDAVDRFAVPVAATREATERAGVPAGELANLGAILRLFAGLLPGLILNVAMFHRAIA